MDVDVAEAAVSVVVPNTGMCVGCCLNVEEKYYIVKHSGEKGSSYKSCTLFYNSSFSSATNYGAHLCRGCKRSIEKSLKAYEKADQLYDTIMKKSQNFINKISSKRPSSPKSGQSKRMKTFDMLADCIPETDSERGAMTRNSPIEWMGKNSNSMIDLDQPHADSFKHDQADCIPETDSERGAMTRNSPIEWMGKNSNSMIDLDQPHADSFKHDQAGCNEVSVQTNQSVDISTQTILRKEPEKRTDLITFRSLQLKEALGSSVKRLSTGNVKAAIKSLLQHEQEGIKQKAYEGLHAVVKDECSTYAKKQGTHIRSTINDIESFKFENLTNELKIESPVLWRVLAAAATNRKNNKAEIRITTAASILYNSRRILLNSLQRTVGFTLYNNHLQKEGFLILSKLGITNSYSTVNKDLHKIKRNSEKQLLVMKTGLEKNCSSQNGDKNDHSYYMTKKTENAEDDHTYNQKPFTCHIITEALQPGYRFNVDNLDFYLKVRNMTQDHQNSSKHYVQLMAIKDRVNCEHLNDTQQIADLKDIPNCEFLPNAEDIYSLRQDMINITAEILIQNLESFKVFDGVLDHSLKHTYTSEMKEKSCVIPLGILPLNENKTTEMVEILKYLHKFVPGSRDEEEIQDEEFRDDTSAGMRVVPLGGDQLTCERIRCAHRSRMCGDTPEERLEGVITMVEDFHEKMNFLQVIMDTYYKTSSSREVGTLYHLRNFINRRNVVQNVSKDYHAVSEFVDLVTDCHVITAALEKFNMSDMDSDCNRIQPDIAQEDIPTKKRLLLQLSGEIVDDFFLNKLTASINRFDYENCNAEMPGNEDDSMYNYATNFTKLGLLRKLSALATKSGDGMRMLRHWKYAALLYHQAKKTKYRLEAFLLLAGVNALFTPRQRHQIIHNRFVNLKGGEGHNLDGDYVMELMNRYAKSRIKTLGPNHSPDIVDRIGKTMTTCHNIQANLENSIHVSPISRSHTAQNLKKDKVSITKQLKDARVFKIHHGRIHQSFPLESHDLFGNIDIHKFHMYIKEKKIEYSNRKLAF